jgi:hypothetical protein
MTDLSIIPLERISKVERDIEKASLFSVSSYGFPQIGSEGFDENIIVQSSMNK